MLVHNYTTHLIKYHPFQQEAKPHWNITTSSDKISPIVRISRCVFSYPRKFIILPYESPIRDWVSLYKYWDAQSFVVLQSGFKWYCVDICCGFGASSCTCMPFAVNFRTYQIMLTLKFDCKYINYVLTFYMQNFLRWFHPLKYLQIVYF